MLPFFCVICFVFLLGSFAQAKENTVYYAVTETGGAFLREGPDTLSKSIKRLYQGDLVLVTEDSGQWVKGKTLTGQEGYIYKSFAQPAEIKETAVKEISFSTDKAVFRKGQTFRLDAAFSPDAVLQWNVEDPSVAEVVSHFTYQGNQIAFLKGKAVGKTTVTCSDLLGTKTASCTVTVTREAPVRFAYQQDNAAGAGRVVTLCAITGPEAEEVRFESDEIDLGSGVTNQFTASAYGSNQIKLFTYDTYIENPGTYTVWVRAKGEKGYYAEPLSFTVFAGKGGSALVSDTSSRQTSNDAIDLIARYESYLPEVYDDPLVPGTPTVGYGYTMEQNTAFYNELTAEEARAMLVQEVNTRYGAAVERFRETYGISMSQTQFDALTSFSYNLGTGYIDNPEQYGMFQTLLNSVVPPDSLSDDQPVSATLNWTDGVLYPFLDRTEQGKTIPAGTTVSVVEFCQDPGNGAGWYRVKVGEEEGWIPSGLVHLAGDYPRDLAYTDTITFASSMLSYHHANGCVPGLLYRRLREAKLFCYGNYREASPDTEGSAENTYGFIYPSCMKEYE